MDMRRGAGEFWQLNPARLSTDTGVGVSQERWQSSIQARTHAYRNRYIFSPCRAQNGSRTTFIPIALMLSRSLVVIQEFS